MPPKEREDRSASINFNSLLILILLPICGWTLVTLLDVKDTLTKTVGRVDALSAQVPGLVQSDKEQAAAIVDLRIAQSRGYRPAPTSTSPGP